MQDSSRKCSYPLQYIYLSITNVIMNSTFWIDDWVVDFVEVPTEVFLYSILVGLINGCWILELDQRILYPANKTGWGGIE
jgi:hypothetical protein